MLPVARFSRSGVAAEPNCDKQAKRTLVAAGSGAELGATRVKEELLAGSQSYSPVQTGPARGIDGSKTACFWADQSQEAPAFGSASEERFAIFEHNLTPVHTAD